MLKEFDKRNIFKNKNTSQIENGFTLVELMVATTIFTIVALMGIAILLSSQAVYKRSSATRATADNLNLIMDSITRDIKFGTDYSNSSSTAKIDTTSGTYDSSISFTPEDQSLASTSVFYYDINSKSMFRADYASSSGVLTEIRNSKMNSDDVAIDAFKVKVSGTKWSSDSTPDYQQPSVYIYLSGVIKQKKGNLGSGAATSTFALESFISQRLLDK